MTELEVTPIHELTRWREATGWRADPHRPRGTPEQRRRLLGLVASLAAGELVPVWLLSETLDGSGFRLAHFASDLHLATALRPEPTTTGHEPARKDPR